MTESAEAGQSHASKLPRAVIALGWVSLLTDAASDMIYPLVPALLLSLGAGATALGWVEGVAEAVAAGFKLLVGRWSDKTGRRKPFVAIGYALSTAARPMFAVVTAPAQAVLVRSLDRVGKGLRGPPRDALVAGSVVAARRGHAFGFHRMMDNLGGVLGPVLAFALLKLIELPLRQVFVLSVIPGVLAVLVVLLFVQELPVPAAATGSATAGGAPRPGRAEAASGSPRAGGPLPAEARRYLAVVLLFSLAGSGDLFLMQRLTGLGLDIALVPLAWVSLQLGKALLNVPGGRASDRFGRKRVLSIAWLLYGATYAGFAFARSWHAAWLLLGLYAVHYGLAEGGQRALLAEQVPPEARGRAYGYQLAIEGAAVLPANVVFGMVYDRLGAEWAFLGGGGIAVVAAACLAWLVR